MYKSSQFSLLAILMLFAIGVAGAAPAFPPGAEAREAKLLARINPQTHTWIKQEAARQAASKSTSEGTALQAVRSAGPSLNWAGMSVEDAAMLIMMLIARDADQDMKQLLTDMQKTNARKRDQRQANGKQKAAQAPMKNQMRQDYSAQQANSRITRSPALDRYLASLRVSHDSLGDLSQEQHHKMQKQMEKMTKAEEAISRIMKKSSQTSSSIIGNMK